jgi:hypothetical protein
LLTFAALLFACLRTCPPACPPARLPACLRACLPVAALQEFQRRVADIVAMP